MTFLEMVAEISSHVKTSNFPYSQWYVGITSDIENRLHGDHGVPKEDHWFIEKPADSNKIAREVERYYLKLGMDGGTGGGDSSSKDVYVYHKTSVTNP